MGSCRPLLRAVAVLELDQNKDIFWIWSYPSISADAKTSIQTKVTFESEEFVVIQTHEGWFYALSHRGSPDTNTRVLAVTNVLHTDDFHPCKYRRVLEVISENFFRYNSPPELLKIYLKAQTRQSIEENGLTIDLRSLPAPTEDVPIKDLIRAFQTETILIYTALLLELRVMIYHHSADDLRQMVAAAASLMSHRRDFFKNTYPLISNTEADVSLLRGKSSYLAGVTDASMGSRMDMIDLWVALPSAEVIIAVHAKESLSRCKTHKDIALFMCRCSENSRLSNGDTVKEIALKTRNLLSAVTKTVNENPGMSAEKAIEAANLSPTLESFYKAIARVEKIHN